MGAIPSLPGLFIFLFVEDFACIFGVVIMPENKFVQIRYLPEGIA